MGRKPANPVEIWRAYAGLGMLAFEAQAVVGMRMPAKICGRHPARRADNGGSLCRACIGPTGGTMRRQGAARRDLGDKVIEVEKDHTTYGEEVKFGGGKVIRDGMGQSQVTRADGAVDTVITNALIVDHTGIYKADIGLKDGRIAAIGKAGNPDTSPASTSSSAPAPRRSPARARS
jgi:hypothetical protein